MSDEDSQQPVSIGGMIKDKIMESVQNMDLATVLQKMIATKPGDEESSEVRNKLKGILEKINQMSEEEREAVTKQIKEGLVNKLSMKLKDPNVLNTSGLEEAIKSAVMNQLILVGGIALVIIMLIVFFGYKLYKSIKDKELKREEKKKAKQMKKKK